MEFGISRWTKHQENPIMTPVAGRWYEHNCVYNPAAIMKDGKVHLLYRAEDSHDDYISRIALAVSEDGFHFERYAGNPVIGIDGLHYRSERRGCEDPRVIEVDGVYYLTYTSWDGYTIGLSLATSTDLIHWKKHGVIIPNTKSGAILNQKIDGKYWMWFGDTNIWAATSDDLFHWDVIQEPVIRPRPDHFDSRLVEPGPPPIMTPEGIWMIYNSSTGLQYNVGQVLLDPENPTKVLRRSEQPILSPTEDFEKYGKVNHVIFAEGLVRLGDTWFLYYGGADKCIGVATAPAN